MATETPILDNRCPERVQKYIGLEVVYARRSAAIRLDPAGLDAHKMCFFLAGVDVGRRSSRHRYRPRHRSIKARAQRDSCDGCGGSRSRFLTD